MENNPYFPCQLVEHDNDYSIILSQFHYFDDYFGEKEAGGYIIEKLAKKLIKENHLGKGIKFDSEAGMFCAYSEDKTLLLQLCHLLKEITGGEELYLSNEENNPKIPLDEAEELLVKAFVIDLDEEAQKIFLENVPMPSLSKKQSQYLDAVQNGTDEEKIVALKKMNSEARSSTRDWENYLSHPNTISILLEAIEKKPSAKIYKELIGTLAFICMRHMPDLRTQPYFLEALKCRNADTRFLAITGLESIYDFPFEALTPLISDKASKIKTKILSIIVNPYYGKSFAPWIFDPIQPQIDNRPKDLRVFLPLFKDTNRNVYWEATRALVRLDKKQLFPEMKDLIPIYKELLEKEETPHFKSNLEKAIQFLEENL